MNIEDNFVELTALQEESTKIQYCILFISSNETLGKIFSISEDSLTDKLNEIVEAGGEILRIDLTRTHISKQSFQVKP